MISKERKAANEVGEVVLIGDVKGKQCIIGRFFEFMKEEGHLDQNGKVSDPLNNRRNTAAVVSCKGC